MKRALPLLLIGFGTLAALFVAVAIGSTAAWKRSGRRPWPSNLGTLEEFPAQFPRREPTADALRLIELVRPLGIDFMEKKSRRNTTQDAITAFLNAEHARGGVEIASPPEPVAAYLATQATRIDAVRDHLLQSREIAWTVDLDKKFEAPLPNLLAHIQLGRLLIARALIRARSGEAGAWEDLRAAFVLDRSLQPRPELLAQLVALSIARSINAAAWKLPLPAPVWMRDFQAVDHRRLLLRGMQFDTWLIWNHLPDDPETPFGFPGKPYLRASMANMALHQRVTAIELTRVTACSFEGKEYFDKRLEAIPRWNLPARIALPNFGGLWSRVLRFEAEREATANALRVRAGDVVIARSRCSDGNWHYEAGRILFTGEIPSAAPVEMPLTLTVSRPAPPALAR